MIEAVECNSGFLDFGRLVRESSLATTPEAWVTTSDEDEAESWGLPECRRYLNAEGTDQESHLAEGLKAFIIFVEANPMPRWFDSDLRKASALWEPVTHRPNKSRFDRIGIKHELGYEVSWYEDGAMRRQFFFGPHDRPTVDFEITCTAEVQASNDRELF